ncbi:two component transcriptional regulator, LuxR family [Lutibacter agarilyticus]|uniref:Two component transcriptional regulator, LuxR family n=1 Tax=Lutibacter agarilyticus TaxID=1109740 RepID=A0A238W3F4_9FLAO|nr:response regulator transcription factor [Lutibacter agarilyticus]SNR40874.1 two component transcriptional regulator, LuxR family [Lutibacter agarilyticus]
MKKIDVIIVDDHMLFSQALNSLVSKFDEFNVIKVLNDGAEVVDYFKNNNPEPDVILMDIQMPIMNGIEAANWLKNNRPTMKVIALSMECEEETILAMLRAGAKGYLLKDIHPSVLKHAINEVHTNGFYYTENVTSTLLNANTLGLNKSNIVLKDRELEFLKLTCSELTYKQIAEKMFLSPKTVENYREALFEKLEAKTRIGLVLYAIKQKIVIL